MDTPISRELAIEAVKKASLGETDVARLTLRAIDTLERLAPVEPEVIHCEKCEHWVPGYITDQPECFVPPKCGKYKQMVGHSASDFCSLAARKEEEDETGID